MNRNGEYGQMYGNIKVQRIYFIVPDMTVCLISNESFPIHFLFMKLR